MAVVTMDGPNVRIEMATEREIVRDNKTQRVPTKTVDPGGELIYTIKLINDGSTVATNVTVNNPVPKGTSYVLGSASGKGSHAEVSLDSGATFKAEDQAAGLSPERVTDVRWLVDNMPAGSTRRLEFKVRAHIGDEPVSTRAWTAFYLWLLAIFSR
ncbi:MAG TPA: hypothetical protein VJ998_02985 [Pseudomonadales bacterium]|nr:hypothetical protein [Pseudomonadales bacterium]